MPDPVTEPGEDDRLPEPGRRLFRNTLTNGVGTFVRLGVSLLLVPFMIHRLGSDTYGLLVLALAFSMSGGYLALADMGLQTSVVKAVADARVSDRAVVASSVASTALGIFAVAGLVLLVALSLLAFLGVGLLDLPGDRVVEVRTLLVVFGLEAAITLPGLAFQGVLEGIQRYDLATVVTTGRSCLFAAGVVFALAGGHGIVAVGVAAVGAAVVTTALLVVLARHALPGLRVSPRAADRAVRRQLLGFGGWIFLGRINGILLHQTGKVVLAAVVGAAVLTRYDIAQRIFATAVLLDALTVTAVIPATASLSALGDRERLVALLERGTRYAMTATLPVIVGAMILAEPLIAAWVGDAYTDVAGPTRLFLVAVLLSSMASVANVMLIGSGRVRLATIYASGAIVVSLVLTIVLAPVYGLAGVVAATVSAYVITCPLYIRRLLRDLDVSLGRFLRATVVPVAPWVLVFAAVVVGSYALVQPTGLVTVLLLCVPAAAVYAVGVLWSMGGDERRRLVGFLTPGAR